MLTDLTTPESNRITSATMSQLNHLKRKRTRRRRWPHQFMLLLSSAALLSLAALGACSEQQAPPSQQFLPTTSRAGGPVVSLIPMYNNKKRLDEEIDGFIMQEEQANKSSSSTSTTKTTEQVVTFETTTTQPPINATQQDSLDDEGRIPIDANRQHFDTHDQLTNATSGQDGESLGQDNENNRQAESLDGDSTRGQRSAPKTSYMASLFSDIVTYYLGRPETQAAGENVFPPYGDRTHVETSAPLPSPSADLDAANPTQVPENLHQGQDKTPLNDQAANLSTMAPLPAAGPLSTQATQAAAVAVATAPTATTAADGGDNNGRQSGGDQSVQYFLSSGNGTADAGRPNLDESTTAPAATTTTSSPLPAASPAPEPVAQPAASAGFSGPDRQLLQVATKRTANQPPSASDQSLSDGDRTCTGYCSILWLTMLCDSTYRSPDCGESSRCCIRDISTESSSSVFDQQTTLAPASDANNDQLQQSQAIDQASRPQAASQVCRGACLPMYHSSLCMKPSELQVESPGCLPNFVCCSSPQSAGSDLDDGQTTPDEQVAASPSDHMISHASYPSTHMAEHPSTVSTTADGSLLTAALVPPPPPMSGDHHQAPDQTIDQLGRQPFYSARPTSRPQPAVQQQQQQATTKSTQSTSLGGYSSSAASFVSQLYQMFKPSTSSSNNNNNSRDKQLQQQQLSRQRPVAPPAGQMQQQASFLSHLFADPYQALASSFGSSSRPTSPPMVQPQPVTVQHYPFVVEQPTAHLQTGPHLIPAATNTKGRYPYLVDQQHLTNLQQQQRQQQYSKFASQQQQHPTQMILPPNESNNIQPQQHAPTDQDQQLLYMQYQMYLQQLSKQNGFSFAPNQQQQRFHYPVVANGVATAATDNAHPAAAASSFVMPTTATSQRPPASQTTTSGQPMRQSTSQMKVAQQPPVTHHPHSVVMHTVAPPMIATISKQQQQQQQQQVMKPEQQSYRPTSGSGQRQPVRIQQQPLEEKGFAGMPSRQQQQQQQQQQKPANQENTRPGNNRIAQTNRPQIGVAQATSEPSRVMSSNNAAANMNINNNNKQEPQNSMNPSPSNVNVLFSSAPQLQPVASVGGSTLPRPAATPTTPRPVQLRPSDQLDQLSDKGELVVHSDASDVTLCPSVCLTAKQAIQACAKPHYIDADYGCPVSRTYCCIKVATESSPDTGISKQQHSSTPAVAVVESNKLDTALATAAEAGDDDQSPSMAEASGDEPTPVVIEQAPKPQQAQTCGIPGGSSPSGRRTSGQAKGRVMGGSDAIPGHWCWQAALMNDKNEYLCGGALIGANWVLTAAHCITQHLRNESQLFVRLGQHNLNSSYPAKGAKNIQVKTSYVHHNHNGNTLDNDVALVRLEKSVNLSSDVNNICLVCLPKRNIDLRGKRCMVTGYGFENEQGPAALRVRQTELPIIDDQECLTKASAALGKPFALPASSFCAGGEQGQDACHGDGGSPLSCMVEGAYELAGIVSWGYKCGQKDFPGLYSKVSTFVGWINQIVSVNN